MDSPLLPLIGKLSGHRVMCVGDVMLDRYVYGQVERISPEAPIPVLHVQREEITLGGAGNVVRNIVSLGGEVDLIGVIGADQGGYDLAKRITSMPQVASYLLTENGRPTTLKTRFVADSQQLLRADHEVKMPLSADTEEQLLLRVRGAIDGCHVIILSDYAKGVLTPSTVKEIIKLGVAKGCKILIDPKGRDFRHYNGAYMLTPNRRELAEISGMAITTVAEAETASRFLINEHNLQGVLAKLGGEGVCLVMRGEAMQHFHTAAREVYDVSGAGDTVMATLALSLAGGLSPAESAELANLAGSVVVAKIGTATVTAEELARELMHDRTRQDEEKILQLNSAAELADYWRKQGLKVGFTNGCFDLLHPGHISLLRQAHAACDKLFVGLNSDASVKRLKGVNRPIQSENSRAAVLASLSHVDRITIFADDTPIELIKAIKPDILIKGADYSVEQVVGNDIIQSWGGKVVLAKLIDGQSTTATIAKLQGTHKTGDV